VLWLETFCLSDSASDRGTELDWQWFYYNINRSLDVLGGSAEPMIGVDTMPDARTASAGIPRVFQGDRTPQLAP